MTDWTRDMMALGELVGKRLDSPAVQEALGALGSHLVMDEYGSGTADSPAHGLAIMARLSELIGNAPNMPAGTVVVLAVHIFPEGREGHRAFVGDLIDGVRFGESMKTVDAKVSGPRTTGGGSWLSVLKCKAPLWTEYRRDDVIVHLEFDDADRLALVTLMAPPA